MTDLRLPALAAASWCGALLGLTGGAGARAVAVTAAVLLAPFAARRFGWRAVLAWTLLALTLAGTAAWRDAALERSALARLAATRQAVQVELQVSSDPRPVPGGYRPRILFRATVRSIAGADGAWTSVRVPVLVITEPGHGPELGARLRATARLRPSADHDAAATLTLLSAPVEVAPPSSGWRLAAAVRASIRDTAAGPVAGRALLPALVAGDESALSEETRADFRVSGLTHLLAVSGTNLTLVVGFLVLLGRWLGVRGRGQYLVAVLGIAGFVLLARTEPSVVRAAAMGAAALIGLAHNGTQRGVRALGLAVIALLLWDPWLATTVGFALSVLATAAILLLAPGWASALGGWLPRPVAEALAVPLAAQLACTPLVAAISGQVSLVAVLANLLAAPLVAPATILGLLGGVLGLAFEPLGVAVCWPGGWCAAGIVAVAEHGAALPMPAVAWASGAGAVALLTGVCVVLAALAPALLPRRALCCALAALLLAVIVVPIPRWGWPPAGWLLVVCDVGQGDALVLHAGDGVAVVVDAGPDPRAVDRCLDDLAITEVPLLVLTHAHADHVDGLAGVRRGRRVGEVWVSPVGAQDAVVGGRVAVVGESRRIGAVRLQVLGPVLATTEPNDASVVLLAEVGGVRMLLTGDIEPPAQQALGRLLGPLQVDLLKIPHHGSRAQELDFLLGLRPSLAVISVGAGNDYGHPAPELLTALGEAGVRVARTDRGGDIAVRRRSGVLEVVR
ncbi:Metallo-beta-lactamase domain-containing protein [Nocardioides dubius]|uniref:ComEC/Rec2 family competence protein n=1 Tax=Nocardioides dubius TaxID=317019 RepID=UPI0039E9E611